jgi:hypothetical protein
MRGRLKTIKTLTRQGIRRHNSAFSSDCAWRWLRSGKSLINSENMLMALGAMPNKSDESSLTGGYLSNQYSVGAEN